MHHCGLQAESSVSGVLMWILWPALGHLSKPWTGHGGSHWCLLHLHLPRPSRCMPLHYSPSLCTGICLLLSFHTALVFSFVSTLKHNFLRHCIDLYFFSATVFFNLLVFESFISHRTAGACEACLFNLHSVQLTPTLHELHSLCHCPL